MESRVVFIRNSNKERYDKCSSYWPFSVSSLIGKTLERILATRIKSRLDANGLLGDEQEGLISKRNTTQLLYRLYFMLKNTNRSRLPTALLNIDPEKVFDSVWVYGLLFKLLEHDISGEMHQIKKSFLKTGVSSFELNDWYQSPKYQIDIGVPQGSVLSPLLFIIFLSDFLSNQAQNSFADDSSLIICRPSKNLFWRREVVCRLVDVSERMKNWINPCEGNDFELPSIGGVVCHVKKTTKSLGVIIDSKLNYWNHSTKRTERANRNWNIIK